MATTKELASGLTQAMILRALKYDPETGDFTWLELLPNSRRQIGQKAGRRHWTGYIYIKLGGVEFAAHRLAWIMMTGDWPEHDLDHIDRNRANNRWANLRAATRRQNLMNTPVREGNKTGVKGVWPGPVKGVWFASINAEVNKPTVMKFASRKAAISWRREQELLHYGEFAA